MKPRIKTNRWGNIVITTTNKWRHMLCRSLLLGLVTLVYGFGCAAEPPVDESDGAGDGDKLTGQCKLNCDNAVIGANDPSYKIAPVISELKIACSQETDTPRIKAYWTVTETIKATTEGGDDTLKPVPFVSVDLIGFIGGGGQSVETANAERCSDACGVVTYDLTLTCPAANQETVQSLMIHSGALFSDPPLTVTVAGPTTS